MLGFQTRTTLDNRGPEPAIAGSPDATSAVRLAGTRLRDRRWTAMRARLWMLAVALSALLLPVAWQTFSVSLPSVAGRAMVDTATALVGALAVFVFVERTRSTRQLRDLLIAVGLAILAVADLVAAAGFAFSESTQGIWFWPVVATRLVGGGILIGAALCSGFRLQGSWSRPRVVREVPASETEALRSVGIQRLIVAGFVVLAVAWLDYLLVPLPGNGHLYAGDVLKLAAYASILCGCLIELRAVQRRLAERVAVDERRRMAREMHDGLAQELAFIASYSQRLDQTGDDAATVVHLKAAAERALHDSRTTIAVLTSPGDAPLDMLIARTAESFRSRFGVAVELDLEPSLILDGERRNAILRILHEALTNAVRHGAASQIVVRLAGGRCESHLTIADDGCGFDVAAAVRAGRGLGLISMGERAEVLGGDLNVVSSPGSGTAVEVRLA
jgi:signal transduction histidine kinase